ncbi:hypothetical protein D3C84_963090 [compost metagenome]
MARMASCSSMATPMVEGSECMPSTAPIICSMETPNCWVSRWVWPATRAAHSPWPMASADCL